MSIKTIVVTFLISAATCVVAQTNRIPGAVHTDLYDKTDVIPFDEIAGFYMTYLK
jgi:membrane protein involved in colicin uptake